MIINNTLKDIVETLFKSKTKKKKKKRKNRKKKVETKETNAKDVKMSILQVLITFNKSLNNIQKK